MRRAVRRYGLWLVLLAVLAVGVPVFGRFAPNRREPVYEGRKLARWLRGHPREYGPAVLAVGTNALPYLLAELQVTEGSPQCLSGRCHWELARGWHRGAGHDPDPRSGARRA